MPTFTPLIYINLDYIKQKFRAEREINTGISGTDPLLFANANRYHLHYIYYLSLLLF
jgi:hypothetical protein